MRRCIRKFANIGAITTIDPTLLQSNGDACSCGDGFHEAFWSVPGVVAWVVPSRAGLPAHAQALSRRGATPPGTDSKRCEFVTPHLGGRKCRLRAPRFNHSVWFAVCTWRSFRCFRRWVYRIRRNRFRINVVQTQPQRKVYFAEHVCKSYRFHRATAMSCCDQRVRGRVQRIGGQHRDNAIVGNNLASHAFWKQPYARRNS